MSSTFESAPAGRDAAFPVDTGTIAWLLPEIASAFDAAVAALRAFRAAAAGVGRQDVDLAPLRVAKSHLHQAHGALELGEIAGVTKLTEAIEDLLAGFEKAPDRCDAIALDVVAGGCRAIVEYLEDLQGGAPQQPLWLFPSYRELLAARGVERIHPAELFLVDIGLRVPRDEPGSQPAGGPLDHAALREQRAAFEQALLRFIRNETDTAALAALAQAATAIDSAVGHAPPQGPASHRSFWWVVRALFDALANDGYARSPEQQPHIKRLAGRINLQIRKLVDGSAVVPDALFVETLFFVAIAAPVTPHVRDVQARHALVGAVPKDYEVQRYGRIDPLALRTARQALASAKSAWSAIVAGDATQIRVFAKETGALVETVGPIRRRGLAQVAQVIDGIATELSFDPRQPQPTVGIDVATALLFLEGALERARWLDDAFDARAELVVARVEASALGQDAPPAAVDWLDEMSREAEERLTMATFVAELQGNLRDAEKVLDAFFRDPAQRAALPDAQKALAQVSGALALLGHEDVHRAIDHARASIARYVAEPDLVDQPGFEALAQSLGAVGFYVEQIARERIDTGAFQFDEASGRFTADLVRQPATSDDAAVVDTPEPQSAPVVEQPVHQPDEYLAFAATEVMDHAPLDEAAPEPVGEQPVPEPDEFMAFAATEVMDFAPVVDEASEPVVQAPVPESDEYMAFASTEVMDFAAAPEPESVPPEHPELSFAATQVMADDDIAAYTADARDRVETERVPLLPEPGAPVPAADDFEAIDAELLEIFLEEAGTVLSDAEASLRVLDADPLSATAAVNLRRGFHTLKGSSRMVGLVAFGEAAWSIEETLNDHLDDHGAASSDLRALVDYAVRYLVDWVDELATSGRSTRIPDALIEAARAVRASRTAAQRDAEPVEDETFASPAPVEAPASHDSELREAMPQPESIDERAPPFEASVPHSRLTEEANIGAFFADDGSSGTHESFTDEPVPGAEAEPAPEIASIAAASVPAYDLDFTPEPEPDAVEPALELPTQVAPAPAPAARTDDVRQIGPLTLSVALFNIFLTEADELLRVLTQDFAEWRHELDRYVSDGALRAAHSLAGSSSTVGLTPAHELAAGIEEVLHALWREPVELREDQVGLLQDAVESLRKMLHRFAAERFPEPDPVRLEGLVAMRRDIVGDEAQLVPALEFAADAPLPFEPLDFGDEPPAGSPGAAVPEQGDDGTWLDESAAMDAEPNPFVGRDEDSYDFDAITTLGVSETPFDPYLDEHAFRNDSTAGEDAAQPAAPVGVDEAAAPSDEAIEAPAVEAIEAPSDEAFEASADEAFDARTAEAFDVPEPAGFVDAHADAAIEADGVDAVEIAPVDAAPVLRRAALPDVVENAPTAMHDDIDPELLDVFVEEGGEILPQIGTLLRTWQAEPADAAPARMLLRHLHTLKGSARMAGAMRLGEVVHDIEARVESAARLHEVPAALIDELLAAHDRSLELFDRLHQPAEAVAPAAVNEDATEDPAAVPDGAAPSKAMPAKPRARDDKPAAQPAVRVHAETLDRLVNLAGEVSISRARIENEVLQIKGAMSDLNENVERLRTQLREIELQAEFQMQSRKQSHQTTGQEREKFDPLEFDRFTRFQELTRMMAESVNDVKTVQQHLQKSLDAAETDLTSQRRMTRDLQQDLMRVRMVPFASIAERLYRVARRTAKEVDKRVNLDISGGSVEIDRSVLERMAGPFEHLLRNHIVHGIESRAARRAAGKDETGELLVEVRQEGSEIVLTFSDDGAGLNYQRIREKGRALGLIDELGISDAQAAELIFHPGFSTAAEVTELAGRGVGMDVVRAEALVLSGRVSVDSTPGQGTRFTINLPLTLAITQVVLVAVASRVYALPAVLVEQVQQLPPQALADAYRAGHLPWADAQVRLAFLGTLLGIDDCVPVAQRSSPVLILRSAGERIAIHVDEVVGNQEVVVKNLGPQLSRMTGIAGATVLGSGQIVLILNPVQLAQMTRAQEALLAVRDAEIAEVVIRAEGEDAKALPTVMVVDDSLTVRRVTQRLLSREGFQVVLAKDGVDALEKLQESMPDVMLVDIEMPRMDGFDLTRNVRGDERYRHIPIVMITSRTAEKHRRHAAELGVDAYLGKPYQEDELIDLLATHVRTGRGQAA